MGVDFSHGEVHFSYGAFRVFRGKLAELVGVPPEAILAGGDPAAWDAQTDPLVPFLRRSDADGFLTPDECRAAAERLEELLRDMAQRHALRGDPWELNLAGLRQAAAAGETFRWG